MIIKYLQFVQFAGNWNRRFAKIKVQALREKESKKVGKNYKGK